MRVKEDIITIVKGNRTLYTIYYYVVSLCVKILKIFVKPDNHLILFVSYGGRYFNDSPRCLYEAMHNDSRFEGYKLVWAFRNPSDFEEVENRVKIDSLSYFITALKARCWITNVHIERGLDFKGKKTYYFNTTHTLLPKVTGSLINKEETFTSIAKSKCDCYSVQCELEREIMEDEKDKVLVIGYPKNDIIATYSEEYRQLIKKTLELPENKTILLYAPTYREGSLANKAVNVNFDKWYEQLGESYYILFRAHPVFASKISCGLNPKFVKDVSNYPNNNDLLIAADILVSDYSGIFFEFGIQDKPMFCYAYDYDEYTAIRSLYFDIRKELPGGFMNEDELLSFIKDGDRENIMKTISAFRMKYIQAYGHATEKSLDIIYKNIQ